MLFARLLLLFATLFAAGTVMAQDRAVSERACGRDASRFCKKVINDGDMAILHCLQQNRARLRSVCVRHLQAHGQL